MRLLLSALIVSLGLWALPAQAQVSKAQVARLVEALRLAAPQTGIKNDGLVSDWQVKPSNIPRWSRLCTGRQLTPAQFEASPIAARNILECVMQDVLRDEYRASGNNESVAIRRAAAWWMAGDPGRYNSAQTSTYTQKVLRFYQQQGPKPFPQPSATPHQATPRPSPSVTPQPSPSVSPTP